MTTAFLLSGEEVLDVFVGEYVDADADVRYTPIEDAALGSGSPSSFNGSPVDLWG